MSNEINHDTCSELLAGFVRGELPKELQSAVAGHLGGCRRCRMEHRAVEALLLSTRVEPLTASERSQLREALRAVRVTGTPEGVAPASPAAPSPPARGRKTPVRSLRERATSRMAPALGAAALLVLLGVAAAFLVTGTGGGGGGVSSRASRNAAESGQREASPGAAGGAFARLAAAPPQPRFVPGAGSLSSKRLSRVGHSALFERFARLYDASDAPKLQMTFLDRLANQAPEPDQARQIRQCGEVVLGARYASVVPVYAASGRLAGRDVLALGFVWTTAGGPLDRFMFWEWPTATGPCTASPSLYAAGHIASG
jgi:anti-sigma factor RsiW